jgi:hypothetical protein
VLPHCAALALLAIHTNATKAAMMTVLNCPPLVIQNSFHTLCNKTLARHPCRDEAPSTRRGRDANCLHPGFVATRLSS